VPFFVFPVGGLFFGHLRLRCRLEAGREPELPVIRIADLLADEQMPGVVCARTHPFQQLLQGFKKSGDS